MTDGGLSSHGIFLGVPASEHNIWRRFGSDIVVPGEGGGRRDSDADMRLFRLALSVMVLAGVPRSRQGGVAAYESTWPWSPMNILRIYDFKDAF